MFEEYIGKHLKQRHKTIGVKYARMHGYPELIGPHSYGIVFRDSEKGALIFRIRFESRPLYPRKDDWLLHSLVYGMMSGSMDT